MSINDYYLFTGCQDGKIRVWDIYPFLEKISGADINADPNAPGADGQTPVPGMPPMPGQQPVPGMPQAPPAARGGAPNAAGGK